MSRLTYRTIDDPRLRGWIVKERVRCGNPGCRCSTGRGHGPYFYLRYPMFDPGRGRYIRRRLYVPARKVAILRQQIRHAKSQARREHQAVQALLASLTNP